MQTKSNNSASSLKKRTNRNKKPESIENSLILSNENPMQTQNSTINTEQNFLDNSSQVIVDKNFESPLDKNTITHVELDRNFHKLNENNDKGFLSNKNKYIETINVRELNNMTIADLRSKAESLGIKENVELKKSDLIISILSEQAKRGGLILVEGFLEIVKDSHGVLRSSSMLPEENDVYVSGSQIKRFNLRQGDFVSGFARLPKDNERYLSLLKIESINSISPEKALTRKTFSAMTPIYPNQQIKLETTQFILSTRIIDLIAPIGKGQRSMIVAPPKAGKTWLLREIAEGISTNHPEIHLMVLLVGERPEEVTDLKRFVKGEVIAANFDEPFESQTKIAEMSVERAKRLVEYGKDVVILMDSVTRLARAYNNTTPPSGRTLSGGFDPVAIYPPKKFFGAARNMEEGGSLTIIATALIDTGSKMDEVIFEEFKGTGNMEVKLDRKLAERRIFPAIDVLSSYTRNEDKLLSAENLSLTWKVIRMLDVLQKETNSNPTEILIERLKKTKNNKEFLATLHETI